MFPYRICGNRKLLTNNRRTRVRYRYNQCFRLLMTNGNQKLFFYYFWSTFVDNIDVFDLMLRWIFFAYNKIIWNCFPNQNASLPHAHAVHAACMQQASACLETSLPAWCMLAQACREKTRFLHACACMPYACACMR